MCLTSLHLVYFVQIMFLCFSSSTEIFIILLLTLTGTKAMWDLVEVLIIKVYVDKNPYPRGTLNSVFLSLAPCILFPALLQGKGGEGSCFFHGECDIHAFDGLFSVLLGRNPSSLYFSPLSLDVFCSSEPYATNLSIP